MLVLIQLIIICLMNAQYKLLWKIKQQGTKKNIFIFLTIAWNEV